MMGHVQTFVSPEFHYFFLHHSKEEKNDISRECSAARNKRHNKHLIMQTLERCPIVAAFVAEVS